jgi:hypothetical protein
VCAAAGAPFPFGVVREQAAMAARDRGRGRHAALEEVADAALPPLPLLQPAARQERETQGRRARQLKAGLQYRLDEIKHAFAHGVGVLPARHNVL